MGAAQGAHLPRRRLQRDDADATRPRRPARQGALEGDRGRRGAIAGPAGAQHVHQMVLIEEFEKGGCRVKFVERPMSSEPNDQLLL